MLATVDGNHLPGHRSRVHKIQHSSRDVLRSGWALQQR
jgi:hypothetical protein